MFSVQCEDFIVLCSPYYHVVGTTSSKDTTDFGASGGWLCNKVQFVFVIFFFKVSEWGKPSEEKSASVWIFSKRPWPSPPVFLESFIYLSIYLYLAQHPDIQYIIVSPGRVSTVSRSLLYSYEPSGPSPHCLPFSFRILVKKTTMSSILVS